MKTEDRKYNRICFKVSTVSMNERKA